MSVTKNGLISRMAFLFKGASADDLQDLANQVIADEAGLPGPETAMFKNDLQSALNGLRVGGDIWNGEASTKVQSGPAESASGSGASAMAARYSDVSAQGSLVEAYARLGQQLNETTKRVESMEKCVAALINLQGQDRKVIGKSLGDIHRVLEAAFLNKSFPDSELEDDDEAAKKREAKAESSAEEEKEDDTAKKAAKAEQNGIMPTLTVKTMLNAIGGRSRTAPLAAPPAFSKAAATDAFAPDDAYDDLTDTESLALSTIRMRQQHVAAGRLASVGLVPGCTSRVRQLAGLV